MNLLRKGCTMKTLIVGAGVIGTIYGWALAQAGVDVTHYVRPGKLDLLKEGVDLDLLDERKGHPSNHQTHYALHCVDTFSPLDGYELVIVPVNADQLDGVLKTLVPCVGKDALFLTFTSNWEGLGVIDAHLARSRVLLGYAGGGGTIRKGVYWTNLGSEIHLGSADGQETADLARVRALFETADFKPEVHAKMLDWLWVHNAGNIGFAAGFARDRDMQLLLRDGALLKTCVLATRELLTLCEKRGIDVKDYPDISAMFWPTWLVANMMRWLYATNKSMQRFTAHAVSDGSLRETYFHYQAMLKTADELGVPIPALRSLGNHLETAVTK
jgi:ketopantoate reductase